MTEWDKEQLITKAYCLMEKIRKWEISEKEAQRLMSKNNTIIKL